MRRPKRPPEHVETPKLRPALATCGLDDAHLGDAGLGFFATASGFLPGRDFGAPCPLCVLEARERKEAFFARIEIGRDMRREPRPRNGSRRIASAKERVRLREEIGS